MEQTDKKQRASHYDIFNYWKDVSINGEPVVTDWGEPSCWCCDKPIEVEGAADKYRDIWSKTSGLLQRCHIVPASLGGTNEPENLFLMCPNCHKNAPNTSSREAFFAWLICEKKRYIRGYQTGEFETIAGNVCRQMGLSLDAFNEFMGRTDRRNIYPLMSTHGAKVTPSTIVMAYLTEFIKQKQAVQIVRRQGVQ